MTRTFWMTAWAATGLAVCPAAEPPAAPLTVGVLDADRTLLPVNQVVTPVGKQVPLPGMRPQVLALSPDGRLLVTSGKTHDLVVIDPATGKLLAAVPLPSDELTTPAPTPPSANILKPDTDAQVSYTGLVFAPDGRRLYLSNVNGSIKVFEVQPGGPVRGLFSIPLPPANAPRRTAEIPAGLAVSADGRRLYVALNLSNRLGEFETATGQLLRAFEVGVAPYDVALVGTKVYVSNWGGRRPGPDDLTGPAGRGTVVRVDPVMHVASEGSVSVIDLKGSRGVLEILVRQHASALAVSPNGRHVVCANAASDNLSVIDTRRDEVVETIWVKPSPADPFGASPNALAFDRRGRHLYVANGTHNAVAVVRFAPAGRESRLEGLIPVGWFPGALVFDRRRNQLAVANIKGIGTRKARDSMSGGEGFNSHQYHGSLSLVPVPEPRELPGLSARVWENTHQERIQQATLPPRPGEPPRPVPERIGEPSVLRHVVYIIKENRTYDQVLGALEAGKGDPSLCIFGESITPNHHQLARDFVLLDNTYCSGILSADGHQWSTSAFGTDYLEKSFAGWPRSYPDGMDIDDMDALAYAPTGFLWDNAVRHGVSLWNFGEFARPTCGWADPQRAGSPSWTDYWNEFLTGAGEVQITSQPSVESLRPYTPTNTVGWIMEVPDVWRARYITNQIAAWEQEGRMPQLTLICLPNDHTSGTSAGSPTPAACMADNDLAFGQIVEALSHSRFWKDMVIFVIEDDPQNGWDHVSGYRTVAFCISPYARRRAVVSALYNTTSVLRTIEQILGLPPMNQFDAAAEPMFDCFTPEPEFTPYRALANRVPLDQMNPRPQALNDRLLRRHALQSARLNFRRVDACPEGVLNRILWHAMRGSAAPYPEWAVSLVDDDDEE
jgi:DNA-binding beta-propeller fold protein YncE